MERLSDRYRVIAPQLPVDPQPGRRQNGINTVGDLSDLVARFVEMLEIDSLVLCGNSLGGLVAIDLCARREDFAEGLVLSGSAGLFERSPIRGLSSNPSREFVQSTVSGIVHEQKLVTDELVDDWHRSMSDRDYIRFVLRVSRATRDRTVEKGIVEATAADDDHLGTPGHHYSTVDRDRIPAPHSRLAVEVHRRLRVTRPTGSVRKPLVNCWKSFCRRASDHDRLRCQSNLLGSAKPLCADLPGSLLSIRPAAAL